MPYLLRPTPLLPTIAAVAPPASAPGDTAGLWVTVRGIGVKDQYLVIGARKLDDNQTEHLLAKGNDEPTWTNQNQVTGFLVKTGSQ